MITIDNYFDEISRLDLSTLPEALQKGHDFVVKATSNGQSWEPYHTSEGVKKVIDLYVSKLNQAVHGKGSKKMPGKANKIQKEQTSSPKRKKRGTPAAAKQEEAADDTPEKHPEDTASDSESGIDFRDPQKMSSGELDEAYKTILQIEKVNELSSEAKQQKNEIFREINRRLPKNDPNKLYSQDISPETEYEKWRIEFRNLKKMGEAELEKELQKVVDVWNYNGLTKEEEKYKEELLRLLNKNKQPDMVERIPEELRIIRRFVNMDGKIKTKEDILRFINSLQKAIVEKRIRKTSTYAEQIRFIQDKLIEVYNSMKAKIKIELKPATFEEMKALTGEQKVLPSINFIKRYIGMNGKIGMKDKAGQLLDQINRAMDKSKITDNDPYIDEIHTLKKHLKAFTASKGQKALEIEKATLNGLNGILGCACHSLNGPEEKPVLMNSMDFANMEFTTIGLKGKWYDLIGDPSPNFTAMVFGRPKMGKSYLCIDFAGYLARHHGKVLYVAKEEGLDMTLQKKLADKNVAHPNLYVASELPSNLDGYSFIFLDSVNRLGLQPADLIRLKAENPFKSFIFVFQTTKEGNFRGANSFQHDVDVVIEIPETGRAIQFGRFNQGGSVHIFQN